MTETHEQRVERLVGVIRAWLEEPGADDFDWHDLIRAIIASDREAGYVTVQMKDLNAAVYKLTGAGDVRCAPLWLHRLALAAHEQEERQDAP